VKSLNKYNREVSAHNAERSRGHKNGIACPECGNECRQFNFDSEAIVPQKPGMLGALGLNPSGSVRKRIFCGCGWEGSKVV